MPAAVIPIRSFRGGKERLAGALDPEPRAALGEAMFRGVIAGVAPLATFVVTSDVEVAAIARELGATVVDDPGGLDESATAGVAAASAAGHERVVVTHADLPFASGLAALANTDGIVLVPDRRHDGTNVIVVPTASDFRFAYGPGSLARHLAEARRVGFEPTVVDGSPLSWDVDVPEDLVTPPEWGPPPWDGTDA